MAPANTGNDNYNNDSSVIPTAQTSKFRTYIDRFYINNCGSLNLYLITPLLIKVFRLFNGILIISNR